MNELNLDYKVDLSGKRNEVKISRNIFRPVPFTHNHSGRRWLGCSYESYEKSSAGKVNFVECLLYDDGDYWIII